MQFFDILKILSPSGKAVFLFILSAITLWVYYDAKAKGLKSWLWALIVFLFPMLFPVYFFLRPRYSVGFCKVCARILPEDSKDCYYCTEDDIKKGNGEPFSIIVFLRRYILRLILEFMRTYNRLLGLCLFMFKKKFLALNFKLRTLYPWGRCHQIVATEGRGKEMPRKTLTYGETLFFSAWKVFVLAGLNKNDIFYDLGCGTGNVVFFANILYDIEAIGIDIIPSFIENANKIKRELSFNKVTFIEGSFLEADFSKGTVFYAVTTAFDPYTRACLAEKFKQVQNGTRIITVTHMLEGDHLELKNKSIALFSGGYEKLYLYVKV